MTEPEGKREHRDAAAASIRARAERKAEARRQDRYRIWFGLGMFGLVGWAIAVPTLLGIALGLWLDRTMPAPFSWTVALLLAGVMVGGWNAWRWVHKESRDE